MEKLETTIFLRNCPPIWLPEKLYSSTIKECLLLNTWSTLFKMSCARNSRSIPVSYTVCLISRPLIRLDNILPPTWLVYQMEAETIGMLTIPMGRKSVREDIRISPMPAKPIGLDSLLITSYGHKANKSCNKLAPKVWSRLSDDCKAQINAAAKEQRNAQLSSNLGCSNDSKESSLLYLCTTNSSLIDDELTVKYSKKTTRNYLLC